MNQDNQNTIVGDQSAQGDNNQVYANGLTYNDVVYKDILDLMGFTNLTPEQRDELHEKINGAIENRVAARIHDALSEDERNEWDALLVAGKNQEAGQYLTKRNIDHSQWLLHEALIIKMELVEDSQVIKQRAREVFEEENRSKDNAS